MDSNKASKLKTQYLGEDLVESLTASTPEEWVYERPARGGFAAKYVPGFRFTQKLNECFGFLWSFDVLDISEKDDHIVAKGKLTVLIPEKVITGDSETTHMEAIEISKVQFGGATVRRYAQDVRNARTGVITFKQGDVIDLGNDYKAAATDAKKKCASELGMFSDVYRGGESTEESGVSKAHLETLYMRGEKAGMDKDRVDDWIAQELGRKVEECDSLDVMKLIPKLIRIARGNKVT